MVRSQLEKIPIGAAQRTEKDIAMLKKSLFAAVALCALGAASFAHAGDAAATDKHPVNPTVAADKEKTKADHATAVAARAKVKSDVAQLKTDKAAGNKEAVAADKATLKADVKQAHESHKIVKADEKQTREDRKAARVERKKPAGN
jgi:hypothetical protein